MTPNPTPARRGPQRRADDFEHDVTRWAALIALHGGKLIAAGVAIASFLTWLLVTAGYRYVGPPQDLKRLEGRVDSVIRHIQITDSTTAAGLLSANSRLVFLTYMQCLQNRSGDKYAIAVCAENQPGAK